MAQGLHGILPGGNEFVSHTALIAGTQYFPDDGRIVNLLLIIQLPSSWIACCMIVANEGMVTPNASYHVSVHDRDVIDIKKQLEIG